MKPLQDKQVETLIGQVLRAGMVLSCAITALGLLLYLVQHPHGHPNYHLFQPAQQNLDFLHALLPRVFHADAIALIQLGILLLIATPVARVAFLVMAFSLERDRLYIAVSSLVLAILLYSILFYR